MKRKHLSILLLTIFLIIPFTSTVKANTGNWVDVDEGDEIEFSYSLVPVNKSDIEGSYKKATKIICDIKEIEEPSPNETILNYTVKYNQYITDELQKVSQDVSLIVGNETDEDLETYLDGITNVFELLFINKGNETREAEVTYSAIEYRAGRWDSKGILIECGEVLLMNTSYHEQIYENIYMYASISRKKPGIPSFPTCLLVISMIMGISMIGIKHRMKIETSMRESHSRFEVGSPTKLELPRPN